MDIYKRLQQEHEEQRKLGEQIIETEGESDEREQLWNEYKVKLEAHATAEEQTFYARLMKEPSASNQVRHSIEEHKEAADLVEEIDELEMSSPEWLKKFKELHEAVEHHASEEEEDVFELAEEAFDDETARELMRDFDVRKSREQTKEQNAA